MGAKPPLLDEKTARDRLKSYVFHERVSTEVVFVPHRVPPEVASRFLRDEMKANVKVEQMTNACNTVRFYLLRDRREQFTSYMKQPVHEPAEALRVVECIKLLGDLGEPEDQQAAAGALDQLLQHRSFEKWTEPPVRAFFHLGPKASDKALTDRLEKLYQERKSKLADPKHPDTPTNQAHKLAHYTRVYVLAAKKQKEALLGSPAAGARAYGLARVFLGLSDYSVFGREWAGYVLLREADKSGKAGVVEGVRKALADVKPSGEDAEQDREFVSDARCRAADAIVYFGGDLNDEEKKFVADAERPNNMFTPQE